jgi:hypothetical protein
MVGKATLFVVAGFSLIFLVIEYNLGNVSTRAVSNFTDYYLENYAHEAAVSGANFAANEIFLDQTWTKGYNKMDFNGTTLNVKVDMIDAYKNTRKITSTAEYQGVKQTVEVTLMPSKFSKFAYYSTSEGSGIWWMDKDTVRGPFHTQDKMNIAGHPTFYGKVTNLKGIQLYDKSSSANFYGGYESGINLPLPADGLTSIGTEADKGGKTISGKDTVYITFASDSIKIKYTFKGTETSYLASSFSPNGVIYIKDATVRLKGTVKGQYTVASSSTKSGKGNIYLDDDIVYNSDPSTNPSSTDILGIVAKNNVYITDNAVNNKNINIDASIYCEAGSFGAENYAKRPVSGKINLLGGIIQNIRGAVGTFSGSKVLSGFTKSYAYDERLLVTFPPAFPGTGGFEIVSWYE